ncbi:DUF4446 family protein [Patescibacteria group bacterium]|nr:DUF4446 family protein [Patescibacteria group bacterium]
MTIVDYIVIAGVLVCIGWLSYLTYIFFGIQKEKKEVLSSLKSDGIDDILEKHGKQLKKSDIDSKELYTITDELSKKLSSSITKCGVIRFNPFAGEGGNQSFSIALLNDHNTGAVISSLYSRNSGSRFFAKPVTNGESEINLTNEEREAIKNAS